MEQLSLEHLTPPAETASGAQSTVEDRIVDVSDSTTVVTITDAVVDVLSPRDRRILALERQWFCNAGSKEAEISRQFGMTPTRYFQILNGLIDDPRAMRESPQVVARLRRLRLARRRTRRAHRHVVRN
ncbi:MAG: DUF3263 domain-containing protein [Candidatus Nanopelagicales bacterium]